MAEPTVTGAIYALYKLSQVLPDAPGTFWSRTILRLRQQEAAAIERKRAAAAPVMAGTGSPGEPPRQAPPSDADYRRYGIVPPFYPPVPYEEPKPKPKPRKPMTSPEGRGVLKEAGRATGWGVALEVVGEVLGIPQRMVEDAEAAAAEAKERADRAEAELRRREAELRAEARAEARAAEAAARAAAEDQERAALEARAGATKAREADVKRIQRDMDKALAEELKAGRAQAAANLPASQPSPVLAPAAPGFSLPNVPPWLAKAAQLTQLAGFLPSRERSRGSYVTAAPEFTDPLTSVYQDTAFLTGLETSAVPSTASEAAAALSTETEVCSCRPRRTKRRAKRRGERRICYTRKLRA